MQHWHFHLSSFHSMRTHYGSDVFQRPPKIAALGHLNKLSTFQQWYLDMFYVISFEKCRLIDC